MSVDFTKENKKTNIDYLRDHFSENEEALEFLDGIQMEMDKLSEDKKISDNEIDELEDKVDELERSLEEQRSYEGDIDTLNGPDEGLAWSCVNYDVIEMMEAIDECIGRNVPIKKITNIIRAL